jgi:hypothetical protein
MERVRVLIQKLEQQAAAGADAAALLATVRALGLELESQLPRNSATGNGRVAVMMPPGSVFSSKESTPASIPFEVNLPESRVPVQAPAHVSVPAPEPPAATPQEAAPAPGPAAIAAPEQTPTPVALRPGELPFDALQDVPTLAQQTGPREVHQLHGGDSASINDKLKPAEPELASRLTGTPIKDLRKGIGVNDRFLFLSELFRGDEAMYERSIKTINGFNAFPEAEYWIARELKVILGWDESDKTVQHFYGLVRRRFS